MNMLQMRRAQASLAAHIWRAQQPGCDVRALLLQAITTDAFEAGQTMRQQTEAPSLTHFATVLDRWQEGDALHLENVTLAAASLSLTVTKCAYAQTYADMGLDPELGYILSCARDEPFAHGYSNCLSMRRSKTIMEGNTHCHFTFTWNAEAVAE